MSTSPEYIGRKFFDLLVDFLNWQAFLCNLNMKIGYQSAISLTKIHVPDVYTIPVSFKASSLTDQRGKFIMVKILLIRCLSKMNISHKSSFDAF